MQLAPNIRLPAISYERTGFPDCIRVHAYLGDKEDECRKETNADETWFCHSQAPKSLNHPRREMHPKQDLKICWRSEVQGRPALHPDYAPKGQAEKIDG
jgi:hypothetical protein